MATVSWRGDAPAIAQVDTYVVTTYDVTTTWKITINGKVISTVGTGGTAITTATALVALLQASTVPQEFNEITWSNVGGTSATITATAAKAGKPFTISATVSGGTGSWVHTAVTASSGPNDASTAQNYSGGAVPSTGDTLVFDSGNSDVLWGLDQHAITPAAITILAGYGGKIGLNRINSDKANATYYEYRPTYFQLGQSSDATNIAVTIQGGGGRIKIDNGSSQATWVVQASAQRADNGVPQVLLKSTHASTALTVSKGDVAVGYYSGETSTLVVLNVDYQVTQATDSTVYLGTGVTLTSCVMVQSGGSLTINSACTGSLTIYGGKATVMAGAQSQITILGGSVVYNATGTLGGNTKVANAGDLSFAQDLRAKTVTNPIEIYGSSCKVHDPYGVVNSGTIAVGFNESADASQVDFGIQFRLTRSTSP